MSEKKIPYKIYLEESEMPKEWYNVRADMKNKPAPLLNPATLQPMTAVELGAVFCEELVKQELDNDNRYIEIPEKIRDFYKMYRPAPLVRAYCLEEKLQTPAKIYYKFEGNNTSGSHKLNSAIAQAYYAKEQGLKGVTTETGAGQWGTALSMACAYLDLDCRVFMVKCSYEQKPFRREVMRTYGASVTPSPSETTEVGRKILAEHPGTTGSLGCAISEAVEVATHTEGYRYVLGSVLNQVLLHQSAFHAVGRIAEFPGIAIKVSDRGVAAAHGPAASRTVQLFIEQVRRCCHFSLFQMVDTPPRLLKLVFGDNGLKTVGNDDPVLPFCFPALLAADPKIGAHTADGLAGVSFLIENGQHHKIVPKTILQGRYLFARILLPHVDQGRGHIFQIKRSGNFRGAKARQGHIENTPDHFGRWRVDHQSMLIFTAFHIAVGSNAAKVIATPQAGISAALYLSGNIPAVKIVNQSFAGNVQAPG